MVKVSLVGGLFVGLSVVSFGQNSTGISLTQIAERVDKSGKTISYAAVREVSIRSASGSRTFEEQVLRSKGMLYLSYPKGSIYADQRIYEKGGQRYTYTKSTNELRVSPVRGGFSETVDLLKRASSVQGVIVKFGDAVASRPTIYVEIPSSRGRGGSHRFWFDREKYVTLKRTFGSSPSDEIGGFEIVRIDYSAKISSSRFEWPKNARVITVVDDLKRMAKELKLQPLMIKGSGKTLVSVGQMEYEGQKILRQFYTDGEKRLSLFVMKQTSAKIEFRTGRVKKYQWNSAGMTLVLIGEYTEDELKVLSKSVKSS